MGNISHDFVCDYKIQEAPGHKLYTNDVVDEEIVIVNKEDVADEMFKHNGMDVTDLLIVILVSLKANCHACLRHLWWEFRNLNK